MALHFDRLLLYAYLRCNRRSINRPINSLLDQLARPIHGLGMMPANHSIAVDQDSDSGSSSSSVSALGYSRLIVNEILCVVSNYVDSLANEVLTHVMKS